MGKPLGILGGCFDPVHNGHLRLALECIQAVDLAEVLLVPVHTPAHREVVHASPEQRLKMLQLATASTDELRVDTTEIDRGGVSYIIDTVKELSGKYAPQPVCLIMGMDAFQNFNTWKQWQLIPEYVHIIVADRADAEADIKNEQVRQLYSERYTTKPEDLHTATAGRIFRLNIPLLSISSTRIRDLLATSRNPGFLLPDRVLSWILTENIYTNRHDT